MSVWWSVALALVALTGTWCVGNKWSVGWLVHVLGNTLWITYGVVTEQWGFPISSTIFIVICTRNYLRWRRTSSAEVREARVKVAR